MKKRLIIITLLILTGLFTLIYMLFFNFHSYSGASKEGIAEISKYKYSETYLNSTYGFSFKYPKDFNVTYVSGDKNNVILVQNVEKKIGVQIVISPFKSGDIDMTEDILNQSLQDKKIYDSKYVSIPGISTKAIEFTIDNNNFGGKSRELWFVSEGYLYQMSTYADSHAFLDGLYSTIEFK